MQLFLEWFGAAAGLAGAFMLAFNTRVSKYGWLFFLMANFCMIGFAVIGGFTGLLIQQIGFTASSLIGIYRSGLLGKI